MLLCLFIPLITLKSIFAAPTSSGPTSPQEVALIWNEGTKAVQEQRYQDAANYLERFIARYPGEKNYLSAHLLLGQSLYELGKAKKAIPYLNDFVSSSGLTIESVKARIFLGKSYLFLKKYHEAFLSTLETEKLSSKLKLPADLLLESHLIKAHSLIGLENQRDATSVLDSVESRISENTSPEVKGQTFQLRMKLKTQVCRQFPSPGPLDEGQVRTQFELRGTCLLEALLIFQKAVQSGDLISSGLAANTITEAFQSYHSAIRCPPSPPPNIRSKQTSKQFARYQLELVNVLTSDYDKKIENALELLHAWKPTFPASTVGPVSQVSKFLEGASKGSTWHQPQ